MINNGCCVVWWLRWLLALMLLIAPNFPRDCLTLSSVDWAFRPCRAKFGGSKTEPSTLPQISRWQLTTLGQVRCALDLVWTTHKQLQAVLHHEGLAWCLIKHSCHSFSTGSKHETLWKSNCFSKLCDSCRCCVDAHLAKIISAGNSGLRVVFADRYRVLWLFVNHVWIPPACDNPLHLSPCRRTFDIYVVMYFLGLPWTLSMLLFIFASHLFISWPWRAGVAVIRPWKTRRMS